MVVASLLTYADVTYVRHKYEDAAREEKGKQVRAIGKKERCKSCTLWTGCKGVFFLDPESVEEVLDFCRQRNI